MSVEVPEFSRCCVCIPLRYGLLAWGYLKLIITSVLALLVYAAIEFDATSVAVSALVLGASSVELIFNIVFVVGAHLKNEKLLKVYHYYSIGAIILFTILTFVNVGVYMYILHTVDAGFLLPLVVALMCGQVAMSMFQIFVQFYLILLVRSEIKKLGRSHKFEFVNLAAEAVCNLNTDKETLPQLIE